MVGEGTYHITVPEVDIELDQQSSEGSVKGRLYSCYQYWEKTLNASTFVLRIINEGYILPLTTLPPSYFAKNNASSLRNKEFVERIQRKYSIII